MKDDSRTSDEHASVDEERIKIAKEVDLANNVQARYALLRPPAAIGERLSNDHEGSKIHYEVSLGLLY